MSHLRIANLLFFCIVGCSGVDLPELPERQHVPDNPCDVTYYIPQCAAAGLPHDVGVAWGCRTFIKPKDWPPIHLKECVDQGEYKCCSLK